MPDAINSYDVANALERAVNDLAGRVSTIWLSFVAFSDTLRRQHPTSRPGSFSCKTTISSPDHQYRPAAGRLAVLLPLVFAIYHVYVLLQVVLLARTAAAYNETLDAGVANPADNTRMRQRLANTLFGQLFAGSPRERRGILGALLRVMVIVTVAVAPPLVLFVFELKFLPYHSSFVTWSHRGLIAFDLLAVLLLWAGAVNANRDIALHWLLRDWKSAIAALLIVVSCGLISFPGEPHATWTRLVNKTSRGSVPTPSWLDYFRGISTGSRWPARILSMTISWTRSWPRSKRRPRPSLGRASAAATCGDAI